MSLKFYEHGIYSRGLKKLTIAVELKTTQTISYKIRERDHVKNLRKTYQENPPVLNRASSPPSQTESRRAR
jgi:hypothetical protein